MMKGWEALEKGLVKGWEALEKGLVKGWEALVVLIDGLRC